MMTCGVTETQGGAQASYSSVGGNNDLGVCVMQEGCLGRAGGNGGYLEGQA